MRLLRITNGRVLEGFDEWKIPALKTDAPTEMDFNRFREKKELWMPSMKALGLKSKLSELIGQSLIVYPSQQHAGTIDYDNSFEAVLEGVDIYHLKKQGHGRAYNQVYLFFDKSVWEYARLKEGTKLNKEDYYEFALNASHISRIIYQVT